MPIYIQRSDGAYVKYEGMTEAQIQSMLTVQGLSYTLIDESVYQAQAGKRG